MKTDAKLVVKRQSKAHMKLLIFQSQTNLENLSIVISLIPSVLDWSLVNVQVINLKLKELMKLVRLLTS